MLNTLLNWVRWPNCQINYKSGRSMQVHFTKVTYKVYTNDNKAVEWESKSRRKPIMLNIDEVESIYWLR